MSTIHFIGGEKGGVGKSVLSRVLCQWFLDRGVEVAALDTDLSQGTLFRSYGNICQTVDLLNFESADQIMDRALGAERQVVVELASGSFAPLSRWAVAGNVMAFAAELNVKLVYWHLSDGGFDSAATLKKALLLFGGGAQVIVVRNHGCSSDFSQVQGAPAVRELISQGGRLVDLPGLEPQVLGAVDRFFGNLGAAREASEGGLTPMRRRRLSRWLSACSVELAPLLRGFADLDGPNVETTVGGKAQAEAPLAQEKAPGEGAPDGPGPRVGTIVQRGSATWSEVGEGCVIHHVRFT